METGVELNGRIITVLGSGGAARAVAVECAISGAETVNIVARNEESGKELADLISEKQKRREFILHGKEAYLFQKAQKFS